MGIWQDFRYGVRVLASASEFTAIAILTLALGIGANTAIFSAVNGILLKPLPYADASRLLEIDSREFASGTSLVTGVSAGTAKDVAAQCLAISQLAEYQPEEYTLTGQMAPELLSGANVSGNFFTLLGVRPLLGRPILPSDTVPGNGHVTVVSYDLWKGLLGGDSRWIGRRVILNSQEYAVIGVMPPEFEYGAGRRGVWLPRMQPADDTDRASRTAQVVARLRLGTTLAEARIQLKTLSARLAAAYPKTDGGWELYAEGLDQREFGYGDFHQELLLQLLGAVAFVLLIACVNVGALLLARGWVRQKEVAIRQALGATRLRVIRQFLTESILLGLAGGGLGLLFSVWGIRLVRAAAPPDTPRLSNVRLDPHVLLFTLLISLLTGILFGLAPALQVSSQGAGTTFHKSLGRSLQASLGRSPRKLRSALVVVEVALAVILALSATLTIRSFENWAHVNWGFRTDRVLTMTINFSKLVCDEQSENSETQCRLAIQDILSHMKSLPGVEKVAAASTVPLEGVGPAMSLTVQGRTQKLGFSNGAPVFYRIVTPEYFDAMGIGFIKGRGFTDADLQGAARVAIVDETFAKQLLLNQPLGKQISDHTSKDGKPEWMTVVGEVSDTLIFGPQAGGMPELYEPYAQSQQGVVANVILRTANDPMSMASAAKQQIWSVDKGAPITNLKTMDQIVAGEIAEPRFQALLLGAFGTLGLTLAMVGIYGVISYGVTRRTHEIGVRVALGAQPGSVLRMVIREGMLLASTGVALGIGGALALGRVMQTLLFEIKPTDAETFVGVAVFVAIVSLVACYLPARKALHVDPMEALRYE